MVGVKIILLLAIMGGAIAFMGDKLGSKIGKKRLTVFGLRPHYTSILITILTGILVAATTMAVITASSQEARTALFGMKKIREDIQNLTAEKNTVVAELAESAKLVPLRKVAESASGVVGPRSMSVRKPLEPPPPGAARSMRGP